jgi:CheY-like chemotaxis protein
MGRRILVIDDDPQARQLVAALLEPEGFAVRGAPAGVAGLSLAEAEPPDIILLDVQMPGMEGYEVCRRLHRNPRTRQIPVVMLTASDDPALNRKAYAAGAQVCVPKPFRREGLIAVIQAALAGLPREGPPDPP